jgi:flagellar basal body rod protein FlgF
MQHHVPIRAPIALPNVQEMRIKRDGMSERDNAATEREEITARVARFKATQEKFKRERDEYFVATLENARHAKNARPAEGVRRAFERPPFWS